LSITRPCQGFEYRPLTDSVNFEIANDNGRPKAPVS
jgi:hypothetical protein